MSRGAGACASFHIDLLQLAIFPFTGHSTVSQLPLLYWHLFIEGKNLQNDPLSLLKQYLHNIKQIASGWQHVPPPKHTSQRGRWPRIHQTRHRQDRWAGWGERLLALIVFSLQIFRNRPSLPQKRRDNVPISTGRQTVKRMKTRSGFTPTHVERRSKAFTQGKGTFWVQKAWSESACYSRRNTLRSVGRQRLRFNELLRG